MISQISQSIGRKLWVVENEEIISTTNQNKAPAQQKHNHNNQSITATKTPTQQNHE